MFCGEGSLEVWDQASPGPSPGRWANIRACSRKFWGHWSLWGTHPSLSSPLPGIRFQEGDGHGLAVCPDLCGHLGPLRRVVEPHRPRGRGPSNWPSRNRGTELGTSRQPAGRGPGDGGRRADVRGLAVAVHPEGSRFQVFGELPGGLGVGNMGPVRSPLLARRAQPCTCPSPAQLALTPRLSCSRYLAPPGSCLVQPGLDRKLAVARGNLNRRRNLLPPRAELSGIDLWLQAWLDPGFKCLPQDSCLGSDYPAMGTQDFYFHPR